MSMCFLNRIIFKLGNESGISRLENIMQNLNFYYTKLKNCNKTDIRTQFPFNEYVIKESLKLNIAWWSFNGGKSDLRSGR